MAGSQKMVENQARSPSVGESVFENRITLDELVAELQGRLSKKTLYRLVYTKGMPCKKILGKLYFARDEVALFLTRMNAQ